MIRNIKHTHNERKNAESKNQTEKPRQLCDPRYRPLSPATDSHSYSFRARKIAQVP